MLVVGTRCLKEPEKMGKIKFTYKACKHKREGGTWKGEDKERKDGKRKERGGKKQMGKWRGTKRDKMEAPMKPIFTKCL